MNDTVLPVQVEDKASLPDAVQETREQNPSRAPMPLIRRADWALSGLVILLVLAATLFAHRYLMDTAPPPLQIVFREGAVTLAENDAVRLLSELEERFSGQEQHLADQLDEWQEASVETLRHTFQLASKDFLDWYFSPVGSYTRLIATLAGGIEELLQEQIEERLTSRVDLESQWGVLMAEHHAQALVIQQDWLGSTLAEQYERFELTTQDSVVDGADPDYPVLNLGFATDSAWSNYSDKQRWTLSVLAGTAPAVVRELGSRLLRSGAMKAGLAIIRRAMPRLGVHLARSAATGAATGAASGPLGVATAPAVFIGSLGVTVGTEYALLKLDESRHRPAMEEELEQIWAEIEQTIRSQFQENRVARAGELRQQLKLATEEQNAQLPVTYRILGG